MCCKHRLALSGQAGMHISKFLRNFLVILFLIPHQFLSVNRGITVRCTHACNISKRRSRPDSVCYYFSPSKVLRFSRKSQKTARFGPIEMNGIATDSVEKSPKPSPLWTCLARPYFITETPFEV